MVDMNLSATAKNTLLPNMWNSDLECYLDKAPIEKQNEVLTQFVNDPEAMKGWIEDLRSDADLSVDDFPLLSKEYRDTANELEKLIPTEQTNS